MNQDYEDGSSDKFVGEKIVDMTGPTTEAVDNPDEASVEKNDSEELVDGRPDELIIGKVLISFEITQVEKKLEEMKTVAVYSPDRISVEKNDLDSVGVQGVQSANPQMLQRQLGSPKVL